MWTELKFPYSYYNVITKGNLEEKKIFLHLTKRDNPRNRVKQSPSIQSNQSISIQKEGFEPWRFAYTYKCFTTLLHKRTATAPPLQETKEKAIVDTSS